MGQIGKTFRPSDFVSLGRMLSDERAPGRSDRNCPSSRQRFIGVPNCIEIYSEGHRDLPHGRHFFTRFEDAGADSPKQLVPDLHIDRNTGSLYVKSIKQLFACMRPFIRRRIRCQCQVRNGTSRGGSISTRASKHERHQAAARPSSLRIALG